MKAAVQAESKVSLTQKKQEAESANSLSKNGFTNTRRLVLHLLVCDIDARAAFGTINWVLAKPLKKRGLLMEPHLLVDPSATRITVVHAGAVLVELKVSASRVLVSELNFLQVSHCDTKAGESSALTQMSLRGIRSVFTVFNVELLEALLIQNYGAV